MPISLEVLDPTRLLTSRAFAGSRSKTGSSGYDVICQIQLTGHREDTIMHPWFNLLAPLSAIA